MGEYLLDSPMISIQMGGVDVVLGFQWLQSLGIVSLNFQYIFMIFSSKYKEIELRGIQGKPSKVISYNIMKQLLKKGHHGVFTQLFSLYVQISISSTPMDLQIIFNNHSKVFQEMPKGFAPSRDPDHVIHLQLGSVPPNIRPCRYPYEKKSEIESMIQEMLEADIVQPSQSYFSSPVVMVTKKDGSWRMCPDYR
jgi:hypothetical protein